MGVIQHAFTSPIADGTNTALVKPSNWNSVHLYSLQDAVSLLGNTAGTLTAITTGTLYLAGGSNITLSQSGNSVSINGAAGGGGGAAFSAGVSTGGNTSGNTGTVSNQLVLAGGGNVTLSEATGTGGATVTISAASQSVQTQNLVDLTLAGNTTGTLALISSGTATMVAGNNLTLSQAGGNAFTLIGPTQSVQSQNCVDLSFGGNTAGTLALISSGTAELFGGNNITLSQNGQSVTISGANQSVQTQNLFDLTLAGNTAGTLALVSSGTATLAGGNNITLSQNGNALTISGANQSVQTQNCVDATLAGNTAGTLALISSGTMTIAGGNNITVSQNGNAFTISGANVGGAQTGISGISAGTTQATSGTVSFANSNGVSFGVNGQTLTASVAAQSVQTQNCVDLTLAGNTTGTLALISSGTATLAGGNNITLSQNGNALTISAANQSAQTQNLVDLTLGGNTTGTLALMSSGTVTVAGFGNVTLSQAGGNAFSISVPAQSVQTQNCIDLSFGSATGGATMGTMALISSGTFSLFAGNNLTLSQSATNDVTLSVPNFVSAGGVSNIGNTTGNTGTTVGTLVLSGGNNITLSQSTNASGATIGISGAAGGGGAAFSLGASTDGNTAGSTGVVTGRMELVGGSGVTLSQSTNGANGTLTINAGAVRSIIYNHFAWQMNNLGAIGGVSASGTASVFHFPVHAYATITEMDWIGSLVGNSGAPGTINMTVGVYTLNHSTASLASSGSAAYTWASGGATSASSQYGGNSGMQFRTMPLNLTLTPGEYLCAYMVQNVTSLTSFVITAFGFSTFNVGYQGNNAFTPGWNWGIYSASTTALPSSIQVADINILTAPAQKMLGMTFRGTY